MWLGEFHSRTSPESSGVFTLEFFQHTWHRTYVLLILASGAGVKVCSTTAQGILPGNGSLTREGLATAWTSRPFTVQFASFLRVPAGKKASELLPAKSLTLFSSRMDLFHNWVSLLFGSLAWWPISLNTVSDCQDF